jgi:hypothetical protein
LTDKKKLAAAQQDRDQAKKKFLEIWTRNRDDGSGWAMKSQEIRMVDERYGTIELRNLEAEQSPSDLVTLIALLRGRIEMAERQKGIIDLLPDSDLSLHLPDDDHLRTGCHKELFKQDMLGDEVERQVAERFYKYVMDTDGVAKQLRASWDSKKALLDLSKYMPETVANAIRAKLSQTH